MKLITNNPFKIEQLRKLGLQVSDRVPIRILPGLYNRKYLKSKRERMMHDIFDDNDENDVNSHTMPAGNDTPHSSTNTEASTESSSSSSSSSDDYEKPVSHPPEEMISRRKYALGKETVVAAIEAIKRGEIVVVVDDENRENEGDLIMAAEKCTPENVGFIVRHTSGVLCVSLENSRLMVVQMILIIHT